VQHKRLISSGFLEEKDYINLEYVKELILMNNYRIVLDVILDHLIKVLYTANNFLSSSEWLLIFQPMTLSSRFHFDIIESY
jgi:hypothetical protein